ncbi:hypothetical protein [Clostridium saccharobutylicum]|uniref:Uncharacterized protein n=1 Tax=Clostridium saccharobutylicum DSM 13864 TaxID=1345695 RepID=U5MT52_CLOSA|nr:hypothetical protein [Clostridium saccharobutylicum]AGX43775.1 hypothetical protein CLSA_c28060 [Clostridium saccharobutylicum DSM 13864]AQR91074.1 hypothetical protein CLOSC_27980 [Clostridium saccharobutylicum]AQS00978.1 hypothetical protein CSACC_28050 [Clostridium saccharobutylicum]AQS10716.1 hypothetical protein CLOBY_28640 [Clostridium saccharobutylicum]AQS14961.1 hypothetical protein CLOSACC_28050 [Clostridium saccharobutylicum]
MNNNVNLENLNAEQIHEKLYNKELNTKKNILEYIEITKVLKNGNADVYQIETTYNFIYKSIDSMSDVIKPNTIMYLKNNLKSQLGKYVTIKDPKKENNFIKFFKEAYPEGHRRKDFTWALMDINKIAEEQIWVTLTHINRECLTNNRVLTSQDKEDIIEMVEKLVNKNNLKYINQIKSLDKLLRILNIKIVSAKDIFKVKNLNR